MFLCLNLSFAFVELFYGIWGRFHIDLKYLDKHVMDVWVVKFSIYRITLIQNIA